MFLAVILSEDVIRYKENDKEKLLDGAIDLPDTINAEADEHNLKVQNAITSFNERRRIPVPNWDPLNAPSFRAILTPYIDPLSFGRSGGDTRGRRRGRHYHWRRPKRPA